MRPRRPAGDAPAELLEFREADWPGPAGFDRWHRARVEFVKAHRGTELGDLVDVLVADADTRAHRAGTLSPREINARRPVQTDDETETP